MTRTILSSFLFVIILSFSAPAFAGPEPAAVVSMELSRASDGLCNYCQPFDKLDLKNYSARLDTEDDC
jgi:hypothetical protein